MHHSSVRPGLVAVALLLVALVVGCSASGDDAATTTSTAVVDPTSTTTEPDDGTTTTEPDEPDETTTTEPDGPETTTTTTTTGPLEECQGGPGGTENEPPSEEVVYTEGFAIVHYVDAEGEQCLELELDLDAENVFEANGRNLDLRFVDGEHAAQIGITETPVEVGVLDAFTRVEQGTNAWVDSFHDLCEIEIVAIDATSVTGTSTCESLETWAGDVDDISEVFIIFGAYA